MDLDLIEKNCTSSIFDLLELHGIGHSGGSLSVLQVLISLYFEIANVEPNNPKWPQRDRVVLSKAHATEAMYAVLAEKGYFEKTRFNEYLRLGSDIQGHVEISTPGVEYSGGALGQGITFACGLAYAAKVRGENHKVYAVLGDGECHEGSVWEAAMFASHYNLDNLFIVIDNNHYADHGDVDEMMNLQPFEERWAAFGWETQFVEEGNKISAITNALKSFEQRNKPKCVIANTVKNYGVPMWEEKHLHQVAGDLLSEGVKQGRRLLHAR